MSNSLLPISHSSMILTAESLRFYEIFMGAHCITPTEIISEDLNITQSL
jgi:hypothetical protein